jgi:hypothetical protein
LLRQFLDTSISCHVDRLVHFLDIR